MFLYSILLLTLPNPVPAQDDPTSSANSNSSVISNDTAELYLEFERVFQESLQIDLPGSNCTPSFIDEFPPDPFTNSQRRRGYIIIHCIICLYVFYAFALVCGDYFVPSVEHLSQDLKIESDIAGATIMGIATSSPELFTSIVGTFIMRGDIGVGTVVGSAVFNHLAVCAFIGFGCTCTIKLAWWPVTRDVIFYTISVIALFIVLWDCKIFWYESAFMLALYGLYIYGMYYDNELRSWVERVLSWEPHFTWNGHRGKYKVKQPSRKKSLRIMGNQENSASTDTIVTISHGIAFTIGPVSIYPKKGNESVETSASRKVLTWIKWSIQWPIKAVMSLTIPDCRLENGRKRWYGVTFIMSTLWIAVLSYLAAWMMTIVGKFDNWGIVKKMERTHDINVSCILYL